MSGLSVYFKDFVTDFKDRLPNTNYRKASTPDGIATAYEIVPQWVYDMGEGEKPIESRLNIEGPSFRAPRGIQPPKAMGGGDAAKGKPAIQVVFRMDNPDHVLFAGTLGTKHEYRSKKGVTARVNEDFKEPDGCMGLLYDWSIENYARFLAQQDAKDDPDMDPNEIDISHYARAADPKNGITRKMFYYERMEDGKVVEGSNPTKFFKIMSFRPGSPDENMAKFTLANGEKADIKKLYGQGMEFTPFICYRRIFIGEKVSVTMEITEAVITELFDTQGIVPVRSSRLIERLSKEDPSRADEVASKYKALCDGEPVKLNDNPVEKTSGCKVDIEETSTIPPETTGYEDETSITISARTKPKFPGALKAKATE